MRVAVLGDAHGNLPALEAVLRDARRRRPDVIWNLGDLVGYGPNPEEVVAKVKSAEILSISGNFDQRVLDWRPGGVPGKDELKERWIASGWTRENLSPESLAFLKGLPPQRRVEHGGKTVLLTHGSPASRTERIEPRTPQRRLRELARIANAEIVLCGHSHIPSARQVDGVWFVNPGGAGRSDDGDPRASYAVLDIAPDSVRITHRRVAYDTKGVAMAIRRLGLPEAFAQMFLEATTLEHALRYPGRHGGTPDRLNNALGLACNFQYEIGHAHQVTGLSMDLFDALRPLHRLGTRPRRWLLYAAILHDVGWIEGAKGHHKSSLRLIESARGLGLPARERRIIGCVARYHRGPPPKSRHRVFASLATRDQHLVTELAAILRVADGLDRTHRNVVARLSARIDSRRILVDCRVRGPSEEERGSALAKGGLLEDVFARELRVRCRPL